MGEPVTRRPKLRNRSTASGAALLVAAGALLAFGTPSASGSETAAGAAEADPFFGRLDVDRVAGASFTVVGEVFAGEKNIVTSGFGELAGGSPAGGGTVQVYRPGADLSEWTKVDVVTTDDDIIFPNQVTVHDVDGDGDNDLLVPGGYFFDTNPAQSGGPKNRGTLTWWENQGLDASGDPRPFVRHDILTEQPWSFHSVTVVDLDDDGIDDLLTTGEQGRAAPDQSDDSVSMQVLRGVGDGSFESPIEIAALGGSIPVVHDVNDDGLLDIVSSQYFDIGSGADADSATFLWLEQVDDGMPALSRDDFVPHTIATRLETPAGRGVGPGFQIRPVPDFRGDGEVAWVGTNHTNRCAMPSLPPEEVIEFVPGADLRQPWTLRTLSNPSVSTPECPADYTRDTPIFPGEDITSRPIFGQAAPGVFGYGDIDGDGDIDLLVSGDGDRRLFWIEQRSDGSTLQHTLTAPGEVFGQSGGAVVADLNDDGVNELVFSSFDESAVAIWQRGTAAAPYLRSVRLGVTPASKKVKVGATQQLSLVLDGLDDGATREVTVRRHLPRTGRTTSLGVVTLTRESAGRYTGSLEVRSVENSHILVDYPGTMLTDVAGERAGSAASRLKVRTQISGFAKRAKTKRARIKLTAKVKPGVKRKVVVQKRVCTSSCKWKKHKTKKTNAQGAFKIKVKVPRGTSKWRLKVPADKSGLAAKSRIKKVTRR